MDVEKFFHMTGGIGNNSYAKNSSLQKKASDMVKHITMEAIEKVYFSTRPKSIGLADLGCSSGPNSLSTIKDIIEAVELVSSKVLQTGPAEFRVYLNDLPSNDFNSIFKNLPDFCRDLELIRKKESKCSSSVFIGGYPGSFYHRLFPNNSLHFVYSSYSLHWLSRVPIGLYNELGESINKGTIYISDSSVDSDKISEAYLKQFNEDFFVFLRKRSEEVIKDGRMVLIFLGRETSHHLDRGNSFLWQLLAQSFAFLVSQGEIKQEKVDSYDVHFYAASKEEIEDGVRREGSFDLERIEMFEIEKKNNNISINNNTNGISGNNNNSNNNSYGKEVARTVRAIQESMISDHFGDHILDNLFDKYAQILDQEMAKQEIKPISFVIVLKKL